METLQSYLDDNRDRYLDELKEWLRIPSISTDSEYKDQIREAAHWIENKLKDAGADTTELIKTGGHPIVYAEKIIDGDKPTVLIYGHYDVQPPDPLDKWDSDPFEPTIKKTDIHPDGAVFARGACDDKGQVYMQVKAFEAMVNNDQLPCNVKFMIEGEEEVGSEHLEDFCRDNKDKLACDVVMVSDTSMLSNDTPSITTGLRGLSYVEVTVEGPNRDLHSGVYGGAVANPINILAKMIASLQDEDNRVTIPGFYEDVEEVSQEERERMNEAPFDLEKYKKTLDIDDVYGEGGYTTLERTTIRPTLDCNGIWGGYTGEGAKTVLPAEAHAKISMRLVPNQDSEKITELFIEHFKSIAPDAVRVTCKALHGGQPAITPTDSKEYRAAEYAMEQTFDKQPIPMRSGGSIPVVALFEEILDVNVVLLGFGLDSDALHSPNEHYGLFNYYRGIETIPYFYEEYARLKS